MATTTPVAAVDVRHVREQLGLSRERLARLLDVSAKTIERWEERDTLPSSFLVRQRLTQLQEIADLGRLVYSAEAFALFLTSPLAEFDGQTALQLIALGQTERVLAALASDYEGLGY